ncbi:MAG: hypothetical protein LBH14_08720 [Desulfobulbaceae bacterium]|jgi:methionine synthase II (cobalamin-independent)|nr:hypothetical protein [Desulfobulbaceae bacterium]
MITPQCRPLLIGSFPGRSHEESVRAICAVTPDFPSWPQLPIYPQEGMIEQFLEGFPGIAHGNGKSWIDSAAADFDEQLLAFFEDYIHCLEDPAALDSSRFAFSEETGRGLTALLAHCRTLPKTPIALKGQLTGPVTFCTTVVDERGRAIFYNETLRDAAIKMLTMKARHQARLMRGISDKVLIFQDEPGLSGFGSSAFITITKDDAQQAIGEVSAAIHEEGGLCGVHVCANTEWPLLLAADVDVLSYDAFSYFDRLVLYKDELTAFIRRGGLLATGIIPTAPELVDQVSAADIRKKWFDQCQALAGLGFDREQILAQSFITPSCGMGSLSEAQAAKVLALLGEVAAAARQG